MHINYNMSQNIRTIITFLLLIGGVAAIVVTFVLIVKTQKRSHLIEDEIHALEQDKKQYEHENMELQDKIAYLKSEHSYEKEAKKLNYKKPGEHVVIVRRSRSDGDNNGEVMGTVSDEEQSKTHYHIWLDYFF